MTPIAYYHKQCQTGAIVEDSRQLAALAEFQRVYEALIQERKKRGSLLRVVRKPRLVKGLYVFGSVGIGKTFLMDSFFQCLPFSEKMRMHFHQFMQLIHSRLKAHQGKKDPLKIIAKELAQKTMLLCFDELFVSDITDAMLLGRLFKELFLRGVCLVATSNVMPDELYKNGLQRKQFLPAIALLKQHTVVFHVPTLQDYRLQHVQHASVFYPANDDAAHLNMENFFTALAQDEKITYSPIEIHGRTIKIKKQAGKIIWFDFKNICGKPRSQHDYLSLAEKYHTIFISDIPVIFPDAKDTINLFIRLVDVFYNARTRLIFSAADTITGIYPEGPFFFEYQRTLSRLIEMQSEAYFSTKNQ